MLIPGGNTVQRNLPCPCGSGKKFKKCCMERDGGAGLSSVVVPRPGGPKPRISAVATTPPDIDHEEL
jgi:hypothetical protein